MYLDEIAAKIREHIPEHKMPEGDAESLLRLYAVLLRAKGVDVTRSDVHDIWSEWMARQNAEHESLVPYEALSEDVQREDQVFTTAIRRAANDLKHDRASRPSLGEVLFPSGFPVAENEIQQTLDLYKVMVQSSESLVSRRQGVNTFFLTMNGVILTASGIILQNSGGDKVSGLAITVLAIAGAIFCGAWRSLIRSFGQLNSGKFRVINAIERYLQVAIYDAEWEALERGEDPRIYRSFTSREVWVPNALLVVYVLTALAGFLFIAYSFSGLRTQILRLVGL